MYVYLIESLCRVCCVRWELIARNMYALAIHREVNLKYTALVSFALFFTSSLFVFNREQACYQENGTNMHKHTCMSYLHDGIPKTNTNANVCEIL